MQNRRNFLQQTTLAVGSFVFSKPLSAAASSAAINSGQQVTILNLHSPQHLNSVVSMSSPLRYLNFTKNTKDNTLLLSTGNIVEKKGTTNVHHIQKLNSLKDAGCVAIVPSRNDIAGSLAGYTALTEECKIMSLVNTSNELFNIDLLPYHTLYKGNVKVGIIGNDLATKRRSIKGDTKEMVSRLNATADFLKNQEQCGLVISMNPSTNFTSSKTFDDKTLASKTRNIDVIVSSNSLRTQATTYIIKNADRNEVILNYQGIESACLKQMNISFNDKMEKINLSLVKAV